MKKTKTSILSKKPNRVLVGISGGVDSSVSVILLKKAGYEVEGVFAKVWQPDFVECTWRDEMKDAMRVCAQLDIPFHFLDLEKEYKKYVGDYMIKEYQNGRTPNPDVMCNTHIKFGFIYDFAMSSGFDYVATGHYVRCIEGKLHRGIDTNKDQSYFLWNVSSDKFKNILFPIGDLQKDVVRKIAKKNNLFTAEKKDSQGLCFIGPVDMKSFLKELIVTKPGELIDANGKIVGTHEGSHLYTTGERHGFTILPEFKDIYTKALYVTGKDISTNQVYIDNKAKDVKSVLLSNLNFLSELSEGEYEVQFRYRQNPLKAALKIESGQYILDLHNKTEFISEGQSAVIYTKDQCLGGAIVEKVIY